MNQNEIYVPDGAMQTAPSSKKPTAILHLPYRDYLITIYLDEVRKDGALAGGRIRVYESTKQSAKEISLDVNPAEHNGDGLPGDLVQVRKIMQWIDDRQNGTQNKAADFLFCVSANQDLIAKHRAYSAALEWNQVYMRDGKVWPNKVFVGFNDKAQAQRLYEELTALRVGAMKDWV
jgi:hypothetical protein